MSIRERVIERCVCGGAIETEREIWERKTETQREAQTGTQRHGLILKDTREDRVLSKQVGHPFKVAAKGTAKGAAKGTAKCRIPRHVF